MVAVDLLPSLRGALIGLAVAIALTVATPEVERVAPAHPPTACGAVEIVEPVEALELTPIVLEQRFIIGATTLDGTGADAPVAAWEQFLYTLDAQPRLAVASDIYASNEPRPQYQMMQDTYGGIWAVRGTSIDGHAGEPISYSRNIWLLPTGSHFRGVR